MPASMCPSREHLAAYAVGRVQEDSLEEISEHLEVCADCQALLQTLDGFSDTLVSELRGSVPADPYATEPECQEVVALVKAIGREPSFGGAAAGAGVEADALELGRVGPYQFLAKLGEGGMGAVYKALHTKLKRVVAVKVLPRQYTTNPQAVARFEREMEAVGSLDHPNIVRASDADEENGLHYLVMEYVEGTDLGDLVKQRGPLPVPDACELVRQAAVGLEHAHQHGLVHRDIKPSNLMLSRGGQVKILDLGLALLQSSQAGAVELTSTGQAMGTIDYMAPEQAGDSHTVDIRADIFSLGATLYKLLTGSAPFVSEQRDTLIQKLVALATAPVPPIRARRPAVPEPLAAIIEKMLAKQPGERFSSPTELAEALAPFARDCDLRRLMGDAAAVPADIAAPPDLSGSETDPFVASSSSKTDPTRMKSKATAAAGQASGVGAPPWWRNRRVMLSAAAAGAAILLAGIIVIVRNRDGKEIAKIVVPDGSSVEAQFDAPGVAAGLPSGAPPLAVAPFGAKEARAHQETWARHLGTSVDTTNSIGMKMALIPPGEFMMGSTDEQVAAALQVAGDLKVDKGRQDRIRNDERPQHRVSFAKPCLMGITEVTIGQFRQFADSQPYVTEQEQLLIQNPDAKDKRTWRCAGLAGKRHLPVTYTSWNDAVVFCNWLSAQEKLSPCYRLDEKTWRITLAAGYRLPTEAEWEYACRAGTTTQYWFGDDADQLDRYGWFQANSDNQAHPVGLKPADPFGLCDMHGNVYEWCSDKYEPTYYEKSAPNDPLLTAFGANRVVRGGYWLYSASHSRSAARFYYTDAYRNSGHGFRVVRTFEMAPTQSAEQDVASTVQQPSIPLQSNQPKNHAPALAVAAFDAEQARAHQDAWAKHLGATVETTNSLGMKMVLIPPGEFMMGSTDKQIEEALKVAEAHEVGEDPRRRIRNAERPQHRVVLHQPFLMGTTEVTIGQFKKFANDSGYRTEAEQAEIAARSVPQQPAAPGQPQQALPRMRSYSRPDWPVTDESPAVVITWNDAVAFCNWLSDREKLEKHYAGTVAKWTVLKGNGYHLPTEAQWEYACRAGTTSQYAFGDDVKLLAQYARYGFAQAALDVGSKLPNPFGLHDMHGNAWEWCQDWYDSQSYEKSVADDPSGPTSGDYRVMRGGDWSGKASYCRSAFRSSDRPDCRYNLYGFRVVRGFEESRANQATLGNAAMPAMATHSPDRKAAEWVLGIGGKVRVIVDGKRSGDISNLKQLPQEPFTVWFIHPLAGNKEITDAGMENLRGLRDLESIDLNVTIVSDAGLECLAQSQKLKSLVIHSCNKLTPRGLEHLARFPNLRDLHVGFWVMDDRGAPAIGRLLQLTTLQIQHCKITDAAFAEFANLTQLDTLVADVTDVGDEGATHLEALINLQHLDLSATRISDRAIDTLVTLNKLHSLFLGATGITDAGLEKLAAMTNLSELGVNNTWVSAAGVQKLQAALPACKIEMAHDRTFAEINVQKRGTVRLRIGETITAPIDKVEDLPEREFFVHAVPKVRIHPMAFFRGLSRVEEIDLSKAALQDADLIHLSRLTSLKSLNLKGTTVTQAGIETLQKTLPECIIKSDFNPSGADGK